LSAMARAWATPGSEFSDDQRVLGVVLDGIERLLAAGYHEGAASYDNWWDWEIGAARPLADLMCLLRDELPESLLRDTGAAIRYFNADPAYSELMNYPTTASNRVSAVRSALVAAIAEDDTSRIREYVDLLPSTWEIVSELDGFYADGGFIQHIDIPYTGNYGADLLRNLAPMLSLLHETDYDVEGREQVWDLIDSAFLPVMVNGHVLDGVRGRAVGRMRSNGSVIGRGLVGAIAEIARTAPPARSQHWFDLISWWASENGQVPGSGVAILRWEGSGCQCGQGACGDLLGVGVGDEVEAAAGEDVESEIASSFGPFVGLFGQDRADEADDRLAGGEDAHGVGAAADL